MGKTYRFCVDAMVRNYYEASGESAEAALAKIKEDKEAFFVDQSSDELPPGNCFLTELTLVDEVETAEPAKGTPTGLYDTAGNHILVGSVVKRRSSSPEYHGEWVYHEVKLQGLTPILSYLKSDKGQVIPKGHSVGILAHSYDHQSFVFADDLSGLKPEDDMFVVPNPS